MSQIEHALSGKSVLVTGATGFIGGRLAQRLAAEEGAIVTGTGRTLAKAAYLHDMGVTLRQAHLDNRDEMASALAGQEIVFHIAASMGSMQDDERAQRINVDATRQLVELAAAAGVKRILYTSSMTAYGPPSGVMPETRPVDPQQEEAYGRTKAAGELVLQQTGAALGVETVVVRPGLVYGPRGNSWTVNMVKLVQSGMPVILGKGDGYATPVYIDNLVDMLLLAAVRPQAAGEAFNASDCSVTWREWFGYYGKMVGKKPRRVPLPIAHVLAWATETFKLRLPITRNRLRYYGIKTVYPIEKAKRLLGYEPRIDLDEGMRRAEAWLREEGKI